MESFGRSSRSRDRHLIAKLRAVLESLPGRILFTALGLLSVGYLISRSNPSEVVLIIRSASHFFLWVTVLELAVGTCSLLALKSLYNKIEEIPLTAWIRAGLLGYLMMGLLPAGRAIAELTRAGILSRYFPAAETLKNATQMQVVALYANFMISVPCTLALFVMTGFSISTGLIAANAVVTLVLGSGLLYAVKHLKFSIKHLPKSAMLWETLGRGFQTIQYAVLIHAVGGKSGILNSLAAQAFHLVGAATGEFVPAQLGFTELSFSLQGKLLGLAAPSAISIAVLAHSAQIIWMLIAALSTAWVSE